MKPSSNKTAFRWLLCLAAVLCQGPIQAQNIQIKNMLEKTTIPDTSWIVTDFDSSNNIVTRKISIDNFRLDGFLLDRNADILIWNPDSLARDFRWNADTVGSALTIDTESGFIGMHVDSATSDLHIRNYNITGPTITLENPLVSIPGGQYPEFNAYRSGAALQQYMGIFGFSADDGAGNKTGFAGLQALVRDTVNTSEDARIWMAGLIDGTWREFVRWEASNASGDPEIQVNPEQIDLDWHLNGSGGVAAFMEGSSKNIVLGATTSPTAQLELTNDFATRATTTGEITSDQNDYNRQNSSFLRLSSDAARTITGIADGQNGTRLWIANVGTFTITIANQNASSTAANRIITGTGGDLALSSGSAPILLIYDATTARWRVSGATTASPNWSVVKVDTLEGFANPAIVVTGDSTSGTIEFSLGNTSNSPTLGFYPADSTQWNIFTNNATGELFVRASTSITEQIDIQNSGSGEIDLRVDGDLIAEKHVRTDTLNALNTEVIVSAQTTFNDSAYVASGLLQVGNADTVGTLKLSSGQGAGNKFVSIQAVDSSETYNVRLPYNDGDSGQQITSDGVGGWYWAPAAGDALQRYWIDAGAFAPRDTDGPEIATEEYPTNDIQVDMLKFDGGSEAINQGAQWKGWPTNWNRGTFQVHLFWDAASGASAADSVVWQIQARVASDDDAIDGGWGTAIAVVDSVSAVGDVMVSALTVAITAGGSPAINDLLWIEVERLQDNASDKMAEDAKFLGMLILYTAETMGGEDLNRDKVEISAASYVGTPANSAAFDTVGNYLLVQQFDQTTAETLAIDLSLYAEFESLDSVQVLVGTTDTAGDSVAFAMKVAGIAEGESWIPAAASFGSAFADTLDLGTTANLRRTLTIVGPIPLLATGDHPILLLWRDPSIANNIAADVYAVTTILYGIGLR